MLSLPSTTTGLAVLAAMGVVGALALGVAYRDGRGMAELLQAPAIDVFDLTTGTTGPVRLSGTARRAERALEAPFTGRPCLAVRYEVEERREGQNGSHWEEIHSGTGAVPFLLEDDTGSVLVEPDRYRLGLDRSERIAVDGGERAPQQIREFVDRTDAVDSEAKTLDLRVIEVDVGDDRRYVEYRLEPGERVTVVGAATSRTGRTVRSGSVNGAVTAGSNPVILSETGLYGTVLRVFWHVLVAGVVGVVLLGGVGLLVLT